MLKKIIFISTLLILGTFIVLTYWEPPSAPVRELRTQVIETTQEEPDCIFTDTEDPLVVQFCKLGVIGGYPDGSFRPDTKANRTEMLKTTFNFFGQKDILEEITDLVINNAIWAFKDTPPDFWGSPYVALAKLKGDIKGYKNGEFIGYQDTKRGEAWKIMVDAGVGADGRIRSAFQSIQKSMSSSNAWFDAYAEFGRQIGMDLPPEEEIPLWKTMDEGISRDEILLFLFGMVNSIAQQPTEEITSPKTEQENVLVIEKLPEDSDIAAVIQTLQISHVVLPELTLQEDLNLSGELTDLITSIRTADPDIEIFFSVGASSIPFIVENATDVEIISKAIDNLVNGAKEHSILGMSTSFTVAEGGLSSGDQFLVDIVNFELKEAFKNAEMKVTGTGTDEFVLENKNERNIWYIRAN